MRSPPKSIVNLADWAETRFQLACDEAGVARNKANFDRTGWDYLVEFDRPLRPGLAHDMQPGAATARVQVKSKRAGSARCEMKLSNALRFCREPDPCFVVLYLMSRDGNAVRVFAREFDEPLMEATLRRAREADRDGVDDVNRIRVGISFGAGHDLGDRLVDWLRSRTLVDAVAYATHKASLSRTLGRGAVGVRGTVTFEQSDMQGIIEHAVGLGPPVQATRVRMQDVRFDIPARAPMFDDRPDFFSMQAHPRPANLIFEGQNGRVATFEGEVRSFTLPGLPASFHRARFTSSAVQGAITGEGEFTINYALSQSIRRTIPELLNELSFVQAADSLVEPRLMVEGLGSLDMGEVRIPIGGVGWARWVEQALRAMLSLVRPGEMPRLSFDDVGCRRDEAERFTAALIGHPVRIELTLTGEVELAHTIRSLVYHVQFEAGDSTFSAIVRRPCLNVSVGAERMTARFGVPILLYSAAEPGGVAERLPALRDRFDEAVAELGHGVLTLDGGDFMDLTGGSVELTR